MLDLENFDPRGEHKDFYVYATQKKRGSTVFTRIDAAATLAVPPRRPATLLMVIHRGQVSGTATPLEPSELEGHVFEERTFDDLALDILRSSRFKKVILQVWNPQTNTKHQEQLRFVRKTNAVYVTRERVPPELINEGIRVSTPSNPPPSNPLLRESSSGLVFRADVPSQDFLFDQSKDGHPIIVGGKMTLKSSEDPRNYQVTLHFPPKNQPKSSVREFAEKVTPELRPFIVDEYAKNGVIVKKVIVRVDALRNQQPGNWSWTVNGSTDEWFLFGK